MKAIVVETAPGRRLELSETPDPIAAPNELLIAVRAISLNRGEVNHALSGAPAGHRPGWDYAGVVETAPDSSNYRPGDRVFGLVARGAWAEKVTTSPSRISVIPDGVSFAQAAALPVAGLTAALALAKRGELAGRSVLVTGATGGVGLLAVQLASSAGARVTALVRSAEHRELLQRLGAAAVAVDTAEAGDLGPYDLVVEAVGGAVLGAALGMLSGRGMCVLVGDASGPVTTFDAGEFRKFGGTTLYGFFLGEELAHSRPAEPLASLARQVSEQDLDPMITVNRSWAEIDAIAHDLLERQFIGKAVLSVS